MNAGHSLNSLPLVLLPPSLPPPLSLSPFCPSYSSVDLDCAPKAHVLKAWALALCYWDAEEAFKRWVPGEDLQIPGDCP